MKFFDECKTQDEVKALYRKLAKKFHPDHGGDSTIMTELTKQYENWSPPRQSFSSNTGGFNSAFAEDWAFNPERPKTANSRPCSDAAKIAEMDRKIRILEATASEKNRFIERMDRKILELETECANVRAAANIAYNNWQKCKKQLGENIYEPINERGWLWGIVQGLKEGFFIKS